MSVYDHEVNAWTAGRLRQVLADVPDDTPLVVYIAERPGGELTGPEQVIVSAGFAVSHWPDGRRERSRELGISCDFPSGKYHRSD